MFFIRWVLLGSVGVHHACVHGVSSKCVSTLVCTCIFVCSVEYPCRPLFFEVSLPQLAQSLGSHICKHAWRGPHRMFVCTNLNMKSQEVISLSLFFSPTLTTYWSHIFARVYGEIVCLLSVFELNVWRINKYIKNNASCLIFLQLKRRN